MVTGYHDTTPNCKYDVCCIRYIYIYIYNGFNIIFNDKITDLFKIVISGSIPQASFVYFSVNNAAS